MKSATVLLATMLALTSPLHAQDTVQVRPGAMVCGGWVVPDTTPGTVFRCQVNGPNDMRRVRAVVVVVVVDSVPVLLPPPPPPPVDTLPPPPPPDTVSAGTAPTYDPARDLLLVADNFDMWDGFNRRNVPGAHLRVYRDSAIGGGNPAATVSFTPGRTGQAVRITYPQQVGTAQGRQYVGTVNVSTPAGVSSFQEFWVRLSSGASPTGTGPKWVQHYHATLGTAQRIQIGSFKFPSGSASLDGMPARDYWHVNSLANSLALSRGGPRWRDIADGAWHQVTTEVRAHTARGSGDGVARMWIDGTLVVDLSATGVRAGWTDASELAQLVAGVAITDIHLGDLLYLGTVPTWTLDVDDFRRWRAR